MKGTVTVKAARAVARARDQDHVPPLKLPDLADLRVQFDELEAKRQELEC